MGREHRGSVGAERPERVCRRYARAPYLELAAERVPRSWNIDRIDDRLPRLDNSYVWCDTGSSGKGVIAYVVDSGIWAGHDEFSNPDPITGGSRVPLGYDGTGSTNFSNNLPCVKSDLNDSGNPSYGLHGTKVASVLGGRTLGVAPNVMLVPVRVTGCVQPYSLSRSALLSGLDWIPTDPNYGALRLAKTAAGAADLAPVGRVVNLSISYGSGDTDPIGEDPVEQALRNLVGQGFTVVVAAGNQNTDAVANNHVPARDSTFIVVGGSQGRTSTDPDARWYDAALSTGSNYGPSVDLFAPGRNVMVALWSSTTATSNPLDEMQSTGTSFAAPHVAGAAARYLQTFATETHAQIEARLVANATSDINTAGFTVLNRMNSANRLLYMSYGCKTQAVQH